MVSSVHQESQCQTSKCLAEGLFLLEPSLNSWFYKNKRREWEGAKIPVSIDVYIRILTVYESLAMVYFEKGWLAYPIKVHSAGRDQLYPP